MQFAANINPELLLSRLALESEVLTNVIQTFRDLVPNLLETVKQKFSSLEEDKDLSEQMRKLAANYKQLTIKTKEVPFLSFNQTLVSVPENFKGKFLDYANFLSASAPSVYNDAIQILGEYQNVLSVFLSNKESDIGLKDHTAFFVRTKKRREELTEQFKPFFAKDTGLSKQRLGTVVDRFSDFDRLLHVIGTVEQMHERQNLATFRKSTQTCIELLELVIKRTEKDSCDKISGTCAKNIAEGAYELGKFVEFVALYRFRVQQFIASVENCIADIDTALQ